MRHLKLVLALAAIAAAGLSAVAASHASAFISEETCTESWQTCDEEPSGGAMGDGSSAAGDAGTPGDAGTDGNSSDQYGDNFGDLALAGDMAGEDDSWKIAHSGDPGGPAGDDSSSANTSSFDPKNDGLDPDPFEDPLKRLKGDDERGIGGQMDPAQQCNNLLRSLGRVEEGLGDVQEFIRDPSTYNKDFPTGRWPALRDYWRRNATQMRQRFRHYRATYIDNECDSVLVGSD